ncbi:MAG: thiol reductase thioredoxin [Deltaproteobacteria bacterium]|nr:thiol reductase thioredoxin [Deltaproteobacteria bacterium]
MATVTATKDNFEQLIKENDIVFFDFWAAWCGPCMRFGPVYEAAAETHKDVVFAKVDTEDQPQLQAQFGIRGIPTLMVFREQIGIMQQAGALPAEGLEDVIGKVKELDMEDVRKQIAAEEPK